MINTYLDTSGGIAGYINKEIENQKFNEKDMLKILVALKSIQHRGRNNFGFGFEYDNKVNILKNNGKVKNIFDDFNVKEYSVNSIIGYVTNLNEDTLPLLYLKNKEAIITFNVKNSITTEEYNNIIEILDNEDKKFGDNLITLVNFINKSMKKIYCFSILRNNNIYLYRNKTGLKPLVIGETKDSYFFSNETKTFDILKAEFLREIEPGELIRINRKTMQTIYSDKKQLESLSSLELCHIMDTESKLKWININRLRNDIAIMFAENDLRKLGTDNLITCGYSTNSIIPAVTYSQFLKVKYIQFILIDFDKNTEIIVEEYIKSKKIVIFFTTLIVDENFVSFLEKLWGYGVKEIHIRVLGPKCLESKKIDIKVTSIKYILTYHLDLSVRRKLDHSYFEETSLNRSQQSIRR